MDGGLALVVVEPEAAGVEGNGHHDEAPEPQRTLFSWTESLAEALEKPRTVAASLNSRPS